MFIRYLDDLKATPLCHFVKNKVILNFIVHSQASIIIMNINILRFGIFFALIGIIFVGAYHYRKKRGNQQVHLLSDGASPSNPGATSSKPASKKQKGTDVESITLEGLDDHQRKQEHKHQREVNPISLEDPM